MEIERRSSQGGDSRSIARNLSMIGQFMVQIFTAAGSTAVFDFRVSVGKLGRKERARTVFLWISVIFNAAILGFDFYRNSLNHSPFFLVSIIVRCVFFPQVSYFHILSVFQAEVKDELLRIVMQVCAVFSFIVVFWSLGALVYLRQFATISRINNLAPFSHQNGTITTNGTLCVDACGFQYSGLSLIDAYGFAFGAFDVVRNRTVFENQMTYFFGVKWSERIEYEIHNNHRVQGLRERDRALAADRALLDHERYSNPSAAAAILFVHRSALRQKVREHHPQLRKLLF
jgi:hypothetical protein